MNTFFEKYDGDYLVYQADMFFNESKESLRYIAGTNDITSQMPVMSLQFFPFDLEKFELVYQNPNYRIFRFLKTPETPYENRPIRYEPIYDRDFFDVQRNVNSSDLQNKEIHLTLIHSLYQQYAFSTELLQAGKTEKATAILTSTGQKCPQFYRAWLLLGKIALKQNKQILAKSYFEKALEGAPDNKEILSLLSAMKKKETDH